MTSRSTAIPDPPSVSRETVLEPDGRPAWAQLELFRGMSDSAIEELRSAMQPAYFQAGEVILRQGDEGSDMYLLDQGTVRVHVRASHKDTAFERVLYPPAMFGEMALVTNAPRTASVVAEETSRCLKVSAASFRLLAARLPEVTAFLTGAVGERLIEADTIQHVGKYQVVGRLGAGAVATVFEAMHPELQRTVALKMLSHALVHHPGFADQFKDEAKLIAKLDHEHIVRVIDTEKAYGTHFIVMEKLNGLTLDDLIQDRTQLTWGATRRVLREIAAALAYSHGQGLLHRDIKPSNVFLTREDRRVKLLDFGIAVNADASTRQSGALLGTPYYMSPEQILGRSLDGRSDLYSLGILAYELVTHELPFDAETLDDLLRLHLNQPTPNPRDRVPDVPEDLVEFIAKATAKQPADRFASCADAMTFLQLATELPTVQRMELTTLAISYHPAKRDKVIRALRQLEDALESEVGVSVLSAHRRSGEGKGGE
jgi:serine/threonine protein kinase